jgi:hypothetical protein
MLTAPYPLLAQDHQTYVVRARRLRGSAVARLIRDIARWVSIAAR